MTSIKEINRSFVIGQIRSRQLSAMSTIASSIVPKSGFVGTIASMITGQQRQYQDLTSAVSELYKYELLHQEGIVTADYDQVIPALREQGNLLENSGILGRMVGDDDFYNSALAEYRVLRDELDLSDF